MTETPTTSELIRRFGSEPGVESASIEFKSKGIVESTSGKKKLIRTLAALANAGGGTAVVGVREDDDEPVIRGFYQNAETRQTLTHVAREHTFPPVLRVWDISFDEYCGEHLLRIDVERPGEEPIRYTGDGEEEYPIRHEDNTVGCLGVK